MTTNWTRKNSFIANLRKFLRRFRIVEMSSEVFAESAEVGPDEEVPVEGKPEESVLVGKKQYQPTGRFVIQIRLTGFWRQR